MLHFRGSKDEPTQRDDGPHCAGRAIRNNDAVPYRPRLYSTTTQSRIEINTMSSQQWQFWIDRGGTFTDCIGVSPDGEFHTTKLLSSDRAPVEAIRAILAMAGETRRTTVLECRVKIGTTVSTNALLERRGVPTALLSNRGLSGVFDIGTQERPELFELEIEKTPRLQRWRLEAPGRRDAQGRIVEELDLEAARVVLGGAREEGAESVAIVWMHAHAHPEDELRLAEVAREVGFGHVACSHAMAREIGFLSRGETAIADAYLTPRLQGHVEDLHRALPRAELRFMQSSGGLTDAERFRGPNALLSGPAGGVLGARWVARRAGHLRAIGFDMGGTSTDVSLISGDSLERAFESEVGGVRVKAPMLRIHTVAAGGGSLCRFDGIQAAAATSSRPPPLGPACPRGAFLPVGGRPGIPAERAPLPSAWMLTTRQRSKPDSLRRSSRTCCTAAGSLPSISEIRTVARNFGIFAPDPATSSASRQKRLGTHRSPFA